MFSHNAQKNQITNFLEILKCLILRSCIYILIKWFCCYRLYCKYLVAGLRLTLLKLQKLPIHLLMLLSFCVVYLQSKRMHDSRFSSSRALAMIKIHKMYVQLLMCWRVSITCARHVQSKTNLMYYILQT